MLRCHIKKTSSHFYVEIVDPSKCVCRQFSSGCRDSSIAQHFALAKIGEPSLRGFKWSVFKLTNIIAALINWPNWVNFIVNFPCFGSYGVSINTRFLALIEQNH